MSINIILIVLAVIVIIVNEYINERNRKKLINEEIEMHYARTEERLYTIYELKGFFGIAPKESYIETRINALQKLKLSRKLKEIKEINQILYYKLEILEEIKERLLQLGILEK